jgi:hypothetical protein
MTRLLDTHCHLDQYASPPAVLASARRADVEIVAVTGAAKILRLDFGHVSGGGVRAAASSLAEQAQIRALVLHALGG